MAHQLGRTLITRDEIAARVGELGQAIGRDYAGRSPLLVAVLKGAVVFTADLIRAIPLSVGFEFMGVSSYGSRARTSGVVRLTSDLSVSIEGRDVIIVEDIIDTGRTIHYLRRNLATRHPRSLALCVLLDKVARRERLRRGLRARPRRPLPQPGRYPRSGADFRGNRGRGGPIAALGGCGIIFRNESVL